MGSLLEYHVLLCVNKTQEIAIKHLFVKKGWTYSCQGNPLVTEVNEEIVCNIKEKLYRPNTEQDLETDSLTNENVIPLCDATDQDGVSSVKVTRQSRRKSVLPTRKPSVKSSLRSGSLKKNFVDKDEFSDAFNDQNALTSDSPEPAIQNTAELHRETKDQDGLILRLGLAGVSQEGKNETDSYVDIKDEPEIGQPENTDRSIDIQDRTHVNLEQLGSGITENLKQKKDGQHKRKRKHGRLRNKSRHLKQSNTNKKDIVKDPNSIKENKNFLKDKKPRLEDGKVPDEELPISCYYCDRRFAYEKYLKKHLARVHPQFSPGMFCEYCGANFKRRPDLYAHIKEAHPDRKIKNIQCDLCGNVFRSKGAYVEHINSVHTEDRDFKCDICQKAYKSYRVLKIHKMRHGPAQEICGICGKMFRLRSEVKHHMRRHQNDRRIQCETCNKVFYRNSELKNHQRIHTGEKPYKCDICPYACTIKGNLDKHMKTHTSNNKSWSRRKKVLLNGAAVITLSVNTTNSEWTSNVQNHVEQNNAEPWPTPSFNEEEKNAVTALQQCENLCNPEIIIDNAENFDMSHRLVIDEFRSVSDRNSYPELKNPDLENPIAKRLYNDNVAEVKYQSTKSSHNNIQLKSIEKAPCNKTRDEREIPSILQSNSSRPGQSAQKLPSPGKIVQWNTQTTYVGNATMAQPTLAVLQPVVYTQMKPSNEMQWCPPRTDVASSQSLDQETTQSFQGNFY